MSEMEHDKGKACFGGRFFYDCFGRPIPTQSNVDFLHGLTSDMYEALKRDELLANVAILATPSGPKRNKLTEINLLRLQALAKAEGKE